MGINYNPSKWENGKTVIKASHFEKIEKGITDIINYNNSIYTDEDRRKENEIKREEEHNKKLEEINSSIKDMQADYDSLQKVIIDENASANLQNQINDVTSQLAHIIYKTSTNLGLIENDTSDEILNLNLNLIVNAINKGYCIDFESKTYHINCDTKNIQNNVNFKNGTIFIHGDSRTFLFNTSSKEIEFNNMEFISNNKVNKPIFKIESNMNSLNITNSIFNNIGICSCSEIEINCLNISNCIFYNVEEICLYFNNCDIFNFNIRNNTIRNIGRQFLNAVGLNTNNEEGILYIENNKAFNDIDYVKEDLSQYLVPFLIKTSGDIYYSKNNVKNIIARTNGETVVYDAYLSCRHLKYENNIWTNICNISPNKNCFSIFFKCKEGYGLSSRYCSNNIFQFTDDFINSLSEQEKEYTRTNLFQFATTLSNFVFENNLIVAPYVSGITDKVEAYKTVIKNNKITCEDFKGVFIKLNNEDGEIYFDNNIITCSNPHNEITLISTSSKKINYIKCSNNSIKANIAYLFVNSVIERLDFSQNSIEHCLRGNLNIIPSILHLSKIDSVYGENNYIKSKNDDFGIFRSCPIAICGFSVNALRKINNRSYSIFKFKANEEKSINISMEITDKTGIKKYILYIGITKENDLLYMNYDNADINAKIAVNEVNNLTIYPTQIMGDSLNLPITITYDGATSGISIYPLMAQNPIQSIKYNVDVF